MYLSILISILDKLTFKYCAISRCSFSGGVGINVFKILFHHVKNKNISLEVRWLPSHTDTDPTKVRPTWATDMHVAGNKEADSLANAAALRAQLDLNS